MKKIQCLLQVLMDFNVGHLTPGPHCNNRDTMPALAGPKGNEQNQQGLQRHPWPAVLSSGDRRRQLSQELMTYPRNSTNKGFRKYQHERMSSPWDWLAPEIKMIQSLSSFSNSDKQTPRNDTNGIISGVSKTKVNKTPNKGSWQW